MGNHKSFDFFCFKVLNFIFYRFARKNLIKLSIAQCFAMFFQILAKKRKKPYNKNEREGCMMDTADRAILKALAKNARTPIKELAKDAYLSSPAASSRMERLEKGGVILGYQAKLNHQALGYHILAFVNIAISPERRPAFKEFAAACPNILECHHVTGNYSLILKVAFRSTKDLETFVGHVQTYGTTQTQVVFSTLIEPREIVDE